MTRPLTRMTPRTAGLLVAAFAATIAALMVVGWYFAFLNNDTNVITSQFGPDLVISFGLAPVGAIIALRRRQNPIGWLFLAGSLVGALHAASGEYGLHGLLVADSLPGTIWAVWLANWIISLVFPGGILLFILLLFPSGRVPGRRWRILGYIGVGYTALLLFITIGADWPISLAPNVPPVKPPFSLPGFSTSIFGNLWMIWPAGIVLLLIAGVSIVVRYRRSGGEERQQIKWFVYAVGITLAVYAVSVPFTFFSNFSNPLTNVILEAGFAVALPAACAIAMLKYRLYGIDIVISRTLVFGSLAVLITGIYVGIAVGIGELVGSGGKPNLGLSILATAIVAIGFQPARDRLQRVANRLVYGRRATPYQVLSEFSAHVAGSYASDDVLPRMARVLQEGTGAAVARVWLCDGPQMHAAATWPAGDSPVVPVTLSEGTLPPLPSVTRSVEVRHQGDLLGALSVTKRRGESLTPVEEKLLADLAHQTGLVLKNVRLTADLQRRLEELRVSRQRLVSAQDAERRRLERNLHDGAQQHLVALKVKLGLAEMLAAKDPEKAKITITQLKADTDEALETLRDLARGIYPPLLAEKGLTAALESHARKAMLPVTVDADGIGRYPQEVEATVYFCVLEALQNVQKYAVAAHATVRLSARHGTLQFEVADDGRGFDVEHAKKGSGLTNMTDRIDAADGTLTIRSTPGNGTVVTGRLPLRQTVTVGVIATPPAGDAGHTLVGAAARLETDPAPRTLPM